MNLPTNEKEFQEQLSDKHSPLRAQLRGTFTGSRLDLRDSLIDFEKALKEVYGVFLKPIARLNEILSNLGGRKK